MERTERRRRVLVVEDDGDIASLLTDILETDGYAPVAVSDCVALDYELDRRPDLVVLDFRLTRGGADDILSSLRARGMGDVPILLLSAATDLPARARARRHALPREALRIGEAAGHRSRLGVTGPR